MPRPKGSPIGEALAWVSRITALGLVMFLPAVAGGWLDRQLGVTVLAPVGLILGFVTGLAWLLRLTQGRRP